MFQQLFITKTCQRNVARFVEPSVGIAWFGEGEEEEEEEEKDQESGGGVNAREMARTIVKEVIAILPPVHGEHPRR